MQNPICDNKNLQHVYQGFYRKELLDIFVVISTYFRPILYKRNKGIVCSYPSLACFGKLPEVLLSQMQNAGWKYTKIIFER